MILLVEPTMGGFDLERIQELERQVHKEGLL